MYQVLTIGVAKVSSEDVQYLLDVVQDLLTRIDGDIDAEALLLVCINACRCLVGSIVLIRSVYGGCEFFTRLWVVVGDRAACVVR